MWTSIQTRLTYDDLGEEEMQNGQETALDVIRPGEREGERSELVLGYGTLRTFPRHLNTFTL